MKLGSLVLKSRAILSPLESVSDVGFRHLCAKLGAGLTWTEMIRAQAVARNNASALDLIDTIDASTPTGIQLLAKTPRDLEIALNKIESLSKSDDRAHYSNLVAVDLNFGCPSPSIIREGAGPALLKRKQRLQELFKVLSAWKKETSMPCIGAVGCKIRLGLNKQEKNSQTYLGVAELAMSCGLDYITVHARHAAQRSSESARPSWGAIAEVAELCRDSGVKVIGNGDCFSANDAQVMMEQTGCDGVMIARGAIRNPWIFTDVMNIGSNSIMSDIHSSSSTMNGTSYKPVDGEIQEAMMTYQSWANKAATKPKFVDFHTGNFARIGHALQWPNDSSNSSLDTFTVPRNNHMK